MSILHWLRELGSPAKKCARLGHNVGTFWKRTYKRSRGFSGVMDLVTEDQQVCKRCGQTFSEPVEIRRKTYTSVSWPRDMWDRFEEEGELYEGSGWR